MTQDIKTKRPRGTGSIYKIAGSRFWYMKYSKDGRPVTESTGEENATKARRKLDRIIKAMAEGNWLSSQDRNIRVAELWDRLIEDYRMNDRDNLKRIESKWKLRLGPSFGHLRATQITTDLLNQYILKYQDEGLENATLNRDMSALRRAFSLAYNCTPRKIQQMPVFPARLTEAPPRKGFLSGLTSTNSRTTPDRFGCAPFWQLRTLSDSDARNSSTCESSKSA